MNEPQTVGLDVLQWGTFLQGVELSTALVWKICSCLCWCWVPSSAGFCFWVFTETTRWANALWFDIWVPVMRSSWTVIPTVNRRMTFLGNDLANNSRSVKSSTVGQQVQSLLSWCLRGKAHSGFQGCHSALFWTALKKNNKRNRKKVEKKKEDNMTSTTPMKTVL